MLLTHLKWSMVKTIITSMSIFLGGILFCINLNAEEADLKFSNIEMKEMKSDASGEHLFLLIRSKKSGITIQKQNRLPAQRKFIKKIRLIENKKLSNNKIKT